MRTGKIVAILCQELAETAENPAAPQLFISYYGGTKEWAEFSSLAEAHAFLTARYPHFVMLVDRGQDTGWYSWDVVIPQGDVEVGQ